MRHSRKHKGYVIFIGGLAVLVFGPLLIPLKPLKETYTPQELGDAESQFIEIDGQTVHVKKKGQGGPVFLLLHGFASSLYSWHSVMQLLSQLGTVIAYDRTGFGLSERPLKWKGQNPYSSEMQVELAVALLDHFDVQKVVLVGNSAGGTVAMQIALEQPQRVSAMILVDPAVYNGGGAPPWMQPVLATPQLRRLGPLFARQILARGPDLLKLAWHNPSRIPPEILELYQKPFKVENWDKALWEFTLASRPSGLSKRLDELTLPILVVTGDHDRIVPSKYSIRLASELPNASLEVISNAGHVPHEEQPEQFMQAVSNFIRKFKP